MAYAYIGGILHVDLSTGKSWTEEFGDELISKLLGGRGLTSYLLWREMSGEVDPLSPENVVIFGSGTLTGTPAPSAGRTTVSFKSPASNAFAKSSAGGHFSAELKLAGYDTLVIHGRADKPVYVWIDDQEVEVREAGPLWGKTIRQTHEHLYAELYDPEIQIAAIGPAAEAGCRIAGVMFLYSAAGRTGGGCVMGSKNLKAVVVRGSGEIPICEPRQFLEKAIWAREELMKDPGAQNLAKYGTAGVTEIINESYSLPSYNFRTSHIEDCYGLGGEALIDKGYLKARTACNSCGMNCHRFTKIDSGPHQGIYSGGPEYETFSAFGSGCGVTDTEAVLRANFIANEYGLDVVSAGSAIQFAIECFEKGILTAKDLDGMELEWGNGDQMVRMIELIAKRQGRVPRLLGEGVRIAAQELGGDAYKYAVESKGVEQSRVETRSAKAYALSFAVNPRAPDHLHTECYAEFGATPEARALIKKITGDEKYAVPNIVDKRAEIVIWHEDCYAVTECMGMCAFTTTLAFAITPKIMADLFSLATGIEMSEEGVMRAGRRVVTLEKCFNVREGLDRSYDRLPWRLMNEPLPDGPVKGFQNSAQELNLMLDEYYQLHGWSKKTSWPTAKVLGELGLEDQLDQLKDKIAEN
ncbi:MAG: aldehyde ferredoxin oxidoreductase family protein [Deltaproteobacteria bacterium]|nr:aldehyde ferredoxin oxidoreductase family protein [Deltaproteobacteria bacterium]